MRIHEETTCRMHTRASLMQITMISSTGGLFLPALPWCSSSLPSSTRFNLEDNRPPPLPPPHTHIHTRTHTRTLPLSSHAQCKRILWLCCLCDVMHSWVPKAIDNEQHCNTLQCTATHCITRQHTTPHCTTLRNTATHCTTLQHT